MENFGKESETLEFKSTTKEMHEAIESIAAILNKHRSGTLYFGVSDDGTPKGQMVSDSTLRDISEAITRDIEPRIIPTVERLEVEGKGVVKVSFKGNSRPYSAYGRYLIRVASTNRAMNRDELSKMIKEADYSLPWENEDSGASIEDIDDMTLERYWSEAVGCGRLEMESYDKMRLLSMLDLCHNGVISNAAVALFGKKTSISLKTACYATDRKLTFTDLNVLKGNIYSLINFGESYILNHIDWRMEIELKRIEIPEIPKKAVREIVVNAFAHAMYGSQTEIEIDIHPGFISVRNPGPFPDGYTPEDFVEKNISSMKRNPLIMEVLYRCKDVEKSGTGFRRVNELCKEAGVNCKSEGNAYGFTFIFQRKGRSILPDFSLAEAPLTEKEKLVLLIIKTEPKITLAGIAKKTRIPFKSVARYVTSLKKKNRIVRIGGDRGGYYEVVPTEDFGRR